MSTTATNVTVRVIANGGKFLGADIGGALVTIRSAQTGEMMASGTTTGGSGDTKKIMQKGRTWGTPIPTDLASSFPATLNISEPCLIEVTAYGPMGGLQSANRVSSLHWVIPGQDVTSGDGILMVLPGLLVQVIKPSIHQQLSSLPTTVNFQVKITMMCGCQLSSGGIWDSGDFNMGVVIMSAGKKVTDLTLGACTQLNPQPPASSAHRGMSRHLRKRCITRRSSGPVRRTVTTRGWRA